MTVSFLLTQMTFLRYFLPMTIEANKRGVKSVYYYQANAKYNNPEKYSSYLHQLSVKYGFELKNLNVERPREGTVFMIEGCGREMLFESVRKVSFTYMTDYSVSYKTYIDSVDEVIFPHKIFAEKYDTLSDKNVYLGSPKYDVEIDVEETIEKYELDGVKSALVIFPKSRDLNIPNMQNIYRYLKNMGYRIIVKTRGKDHVPENLRGDYFFEDTSWFPHTSMELIDYCDVVVNFDSTAIKECIMMEKPVVNFHVKPFKQPLYWLYEYDFVKELPSGVSEARFQQSVEFLLTAKRHIKSQFELAKEENLFEKTGTCARILDYLEIK